jgi:xylulokinase
VTGSSESIENALLLAVDASTTACKAFLFDVAGHIVSEGRVPIDLHHPEPDGWEQDPEQWWQGTLEAVRAAVLGLAESERKNIVAGCITHQRETVVATDPQGCALAPALVWMDGRCRQDVEVACQKLGAQTLHELSGKPPSVTPSLYKLMYLLREHPRLANAHFSDVHAWLARRLVGRSVTSLGSADPLGLIDMREGTWSSALCDLLGVASTQLPELVAPAAALGPLLPQVARLTGLPEHLPLYAGIGDGQAACLGAGVIEPQRAYLNLGTAVVSGVVSDTYELARTFRTLYGTSAGRYCLETDLKGGTFTVQWLLDKLLARSVPCGASHEAPHMDVASLEACARHLAPGSDGLVLVPYWCGVMNPYWDDDATGMVLGWHGGHGPPHLFRAILEGIALEQRLHLEGVEKATGRRLSEVVVLGGGSRSDLWCQILADVLNKPVVRAATAEATALGAAMLAALGHRIYGSERQAVAQMTRLGERFEPSAAMPFYDALYREVYQGLYLDVQPRMAALARLRRASAHFCVESDTSKRSE